MCQPIHNGIPHHPSGVRKIFVREEASKDLKQNTIQDIPKWFLHGIGFGWIWEFQTIIFWENIGNLQASTIQQTRTFITSRKQPPAVMTFLGGLGALATPSRKGTSSNNWTKFKNPWHSIRLVGYGCFIDILTLHYDNPYMTEWYNPQRGFWSLLKRTIAKVTGLLLRHDRHHHKGAFDNLKRKGCLFCSMALVSPCTQYLNRCHSSVKIPLKEWNGQQTKSYSIQNCQSLFQLAPLIFPPQFFMHFSPIARLPSIHPWPKSDPSVPWMHRDPTHRQSLLHLEGPRNDGDILTNTPGTTAIHQCPPKLITSFWRISNQQN